MFTRKEINTYHIMYMNECVADVIMGENNMVSEIRKYVADSPKQPFWGNFTNASPQLLTERFFVFLKDRCYEDGRADLENILRQAGLHSNNPYDWVQISHGVMYEDFFWVKFDDEVIFWDDVRVR